MHVEKLGDRSELTTTMRCDSSDLKKCTLIVRKEYARTSYRGFPYVFIGKCLITIGHDYKITVVKECTMTIGKDYTMIVSKECAIIAEKECATLSL